MIYLLHEQYALRGWKDAECALVKIPENDVTFLSADEFRVLLLCNGEYVFSSQVKQKFNRILQKFQENGIVVLCGKEKHSLMPHQLYRFYNNKYVRYVHWSITGKCNFRCRHCYLDSPSSDAIELSRGDAARIIEQIKECGILKVKITGGEPLVSEAFWDIVEWISDAGIVIDEIYTNGSLVDERFIERILCMTNHPVVNMSYDGYGYHDWMRGVCGAEEAVLHAFELCHRSGIRTRAEMCIHKGNKESLRSTVQVLAKMGVSAIKISPVFNTDLWKSKSEDNYLEIEDYYRVCMDYIPEFIQDNMPIELVLGGVARYSKLNNSWLITAKLDVPPDIGESCYMCKSARDALYIAPSGQVLPCMAMASLPEEYIQEFPSILTVSLKQILMSSVYLTFVDRRLNSFLDRNSKCKECEYRIYCKGGCRAEAMNENNGDSWSVVHRQCDFYKKGNLKAIEDYFKKYDLIT